jgi:hypothetical protein
MNEATTLRALSAAQGCPVKTQISLVHLRNQVAHAVSCPPRTELATLQPTLYAAVPLLLNILDPILSAALVPA